jgi:hypothetical protein
MWDAVEVDHRRTDSLRICTWLSVRHSLAAAA